jgi:hypothetical protein
MQGLRTDPVRVFLVDAAKPACRDLGDEVGTAVEQRPPCGGARDHHRARLVIPVAVTGRVGWLPA